MPCFNRETRCLMSYEYPRPTQVAPAARASQIGLTASLMFGCARDFVCTPSFKVGEAWPFVRPYTPLSWMTYNMSRFLRPAFTKWPRSEEHTSELQSRRDLVCRLLLEKKTKRVRC